MKTLKNRIDKLQPNPDPEIKYFARVYRNSSKPAKLNIITNDGTTSMEFPDEAALDEYAKEQGIEPFKIARVIVIPRQDDISGSE